MSVLFITTADRKKKRRLTAFTLLVSLLGTLTFMTTVVPASVMPAGIVCAKEEKEDLRLYAKAAVLMDADSGRVLYGKNENEILPMASTTKIMTCILALEYGNPDEIVEVSSYAASMPKVKLYVKQGEKYRLGYLL